MDVDLDRVRRNVVAMPEDMIFDLLLGYDPALASHRYFEDRGFSRRQKLRLIVVPTVIFRPSSK